MTDPKPFVSPYLRRPLRSYGEAMRDLNQESPQAPEPRVQPPEDVHVLDGKEAILPSTGPADR